MNHPYREVTLTVKNIASELSQMDIDAAVKEARFALNSLGKVEVIETPVDYRKAL